MQSREHAIWRCTVSHGGTLLRYSGTSPHAQESSHHQHQQDLQDLQDLQDPLDLVQVVLRIQRLTRQLLPLPWVN